MGFERNYQVKYPSNQLNIKYFFLHFSHFEGILYFSVFLLTNLCFYSRFIFIMRLFVYYIFFIIFINNFSRANYKIFQAI
jgi:hypothetical protein